jgi:iron complex outermembrane receptor protein
MAAKNTWTVCAAAVLTLGAAGGAVHAQSTPAAPAAEEAKADPAVIVVTGSRIQRRDADGVGPMLTLTRDDIKFAAPTSVGDMLQSMPNVGVSLNSNGTQGTAFGVSSINLRYLGSAEGSGNRTLVLVDGHRWVNAVGGRGFRDFVDLNTIPLGIIDHIEVLKDGASAIYGADAIAGVVNIYTRKKLDGFETDLRVGQSSRGDDENYSGYINWGKRFEKANVFLSASYSDSKPVLTMDRDVTRVALAPLTAAPTSPQGLYVLPGLSNNAYFGTPAGFAQNAANAVTRNGGVTSIGAGAAADNDFHVARLPGDDFNTQTQGIYATGPSKRAGLFGRASWQVGEVFEPQIVAAVRAGLARYPRQQRLQHLEGPGLQSLRHRERRAGRERAGLLRFDLPHPARADRSGQPPHRAGRRHLARAGRRRRPRRPVGRLALGRHADLFESEGDLRLDQPA